MREIVGERIVHLPRCRGNDEVHSRPKVPIGRDRLADDECPAREKHLNAWLPRDLRFSVDVQGDP
jgi:hypothetical protein